MITALERNAMSCTVNTHLVKVVIDLELVGIFSNKIMTFRQGLTRFLKVSEPLGHIAKAWEKMKKKWFLSVHHVIEVLTSAVNYNTVL